MNKSKIYNLLFFGFLLTFTSCKEPGCTDKNAINFNIEANQDDNSCIYNSELNINFKLVNENLNFAKYDTISGNGYSFRMMNMKFYLSDIQIQTHETNIPLKDVHLFNIDNENTHNLNFEIQEDRYTGINFNIGLNPTQNSTTPSEYELNHPLGLNQNTFWAMEPASYIFVIIEGKIDTSLDNNFYNLTYHLAHDDLIRNINLYKEINVSNNQSYTINIEIDVSNIFNNVDFSDELPHQRIATPLAHLLIDNFSSTFEIH